MIRRQNDINTKSDTADNKSVEKNSFDNTKKTTEHAKRNKANDSPNNTKSRDVKLTRNKRKKIRVEILSDSIHPLQAYLITISSLTKASS